MPDEAVTSAELLGATPDEAVTSADPAAAAPGEAPASPDGCSAFAVGSSGGGRTQTHGWPG